MPNSRRSITKKPFWSDSTKRISFAIATPFNSAWTLAPGSGFPTSSRTTPCITPSPISLLRSEVKRGTRRNRNESARRHRICTPRLRKPYKWGTRAVVDVPPGLGRRSHRAQRYGPGGLNSEKDGLSFVGTGHRQLRFQLFDLVHCFPFGVNKLSCCFVFRE